MNEYPLKTTDKSTIPTITAAKYPTNIAIKNGTILKNPLPKAVQG